MALEFHFPDKGSYMQDAFSFITIKKSRFCIKCRRRVLAGSMMNRATFKGKKIYTTYACDSDDCLEDYKYIFNLDERVLAELCKGN